MLELTSDKQDKLGRTALMYATERGEHATEMMRLLLDAGADVNIQDKNGDTALMYAKERGERARRGDDALARRLESRRQQAGQGWVDRADHATRYRARHGGEHGSEMMRLLVDSGADPNKQDKRGFTALMHSAYYGDEHGAGMMRLLVDAGAVVNKQDKDGWTALMYRTVWGRSQREMMRLLLDAGADVNIQNKYGSTTLMICLLFGRENIELLVRLIVAHGAKIPKGLHSRFSTCTSRYCRISQ